MQGRKQMNLSVQWEETNKLQDLFSENTFDICLLHSKHWKILGKTRKLRELPESSGWCCSVIQLIACWKSNWRDKVKVPRKSHESPTIFSFRSTTFGSLYVFYWTDLLLHSSVSPSCRSSCGYGSGSVAQKQRDLVAWDPRCVSLTWMGGWVLKRAFLRFNMSTSCFLDVWTQCGTEQKQQHLRKSGVARVLFPGCGSA